MQEISFYQNTFPDTDLEEHGYELFIVDIPITILISKQHHLLSLHRVHPLPKSLQNMGQVCAMQEYHNKWDQGRQKKDEKMTTTTNAYDYD